MTFRPDTLALTALLGLLTALGPLSTDMYLPSLPTMTTALGSTPAEAQLTLSVFLIGFASTQIFYGPLSDRYGRRPVLLVGLTLFVLATALCTVATSMPMLIAARFLQALGASGPIVLARAVARDLYSGRRAGQELALMASIMGIVPIMAPTLGGFLEVAFGWRSVFGFAALLGVVLTAVVALRLPETLPATDAEPPTPLGMIRVFGRLIREPSFVVYVSLVCFAYAIIFVFISVSSFVLQDVYGLTPIRFGLAFGVCSIGYVTGTLTGRRLTGRHGIDPAIRLGASLMCLGGVAVVAVVLAGAGGVVALLAGTVIAFAGAGLVLPQAMAGALTPFPAAAGAASSLMGVCQMTFGAVAGIVVAAGLEASRFDDQAMPLAVAQLIIGTAAVLVFFGSRSIRIVARAGE